MHRSSLATDVLNPLLPVKFFPLLARQKDLILLVDLLLDVNLPGKLSTKSLGRALPEPLPSVTAPNLP